MYIHKYNKEFDVSVISRFEIVYFINRLFIKYAFYQIQYRLNFYWFTHIL